MTPDEPSWDEIFSSQPTRPPAGDPAPVPTTPAMTRRQLRDQTDPEPAARSTFAEVSGAPRPPRKKRRLGWLWAIIIILALGGGAAFAVWSLFETQIRHVLGWEQSNDYSGTGNGTAANVVIASGDVGSKIAKSLTDAGIIMSTKSFNDLLLKTTPEPKFNPGTYALQQHMSAASALAALTDGKHVLTNKVLIKEGMTLAQTLTAISAATSVPLADLQAATKDPTAYGVPKSAPSLEGFLFPATYPFSPGTSAHDIIDTMVKRMNTALKKAGVADKDKLKVLTLASIVQKEGGVATDFPKVSRVFTNRLAAGMPLQSDATVSYGIGGTSIFTTTAQRADKSNKYNTYANAGLPVGPISAPGDAAIAAAVKPVAGPWIYFVLVNGKTGETQFSTTLAEHNKGVAQFQQWLKDNPDYKTGG